MSDGEVRRSVSDSSFWCVMFVVVGFFVIRGIDVWIDLEAAKAGFYWEESTETWEKR